MFLDFQKKELKMLKYSYAQMCFFFWMSWNLGFPEFDKDVVEGDPFCPVEKP